MAALIQKKRFPNIQNEKYKQPFNVNAGLKATDFEYLPIAINLTGDGATKRQLVSDGSLPCLNHVFQLFWHAPHYFWHAPIFNSNRSLWSEHIILPNHGVTTKKAKFFVISEKDRGSRSKSVEQCLFL